MYQKNFLMLSSSGSEQHKKYKDKNIDDLKLSQYINDKRKFLLCINKYELRKLLIKYNIEVCSTLIERILSFVDFLMSPIKSYLSDNSSEHILFLKLNYIYQI